MTIPRLAPHGRHLWQRIATRGAICLSFCLVLGLVQVLVVEDWRGPLLSSLTVGGICWLTVDSSRSVLSRWRWRRLQHPLTDPGPAADGSYRDWPGWPWMVLLSVAGACAGVLGSQMLLAQLGLSDGMPPAGGARTMKDPRVLGTIVLLTVGVTLLVSYFFYIREHAALSQHEAETARRAAVETQLRLLQAQLEPHMLFNTLANLRVLIQLDPTQAQAMLDHLIAFLRATLQASRREWQTLQEEFEQVSNYLALMQVRMGKRLQVEVGLDDEVRQVRVPPLLLQPLVENAIVHGLEPLPDGGRLSLRAWCENGRLHVHIHDTGQGLPDAHPLGNPVSSPRGRSHGTDFGLQHVRDRLHAIWGDQAQLSLRTSDKGGTLATVRLPCQTNIAEPIQERA